MVTKHVAFDRLYEKRGYQTAACTAVFERWAAGTRTVLVVAPTGSGKTVLGVRCVRQDRTVWVAHRRELVEQAALRLEQFLGIGNVDRVMPGVMKRRRYPEARVKVCSIQTLLARQLQFEGVELVVLDEAHRYVADEYRAIKDQYPEARFLGLTATPERHDGRPLGDIFEHLIQAATTTELTGAGFVMPLRVVAPARRLTGKLAQHPVEAYRIHGGGQRAILFAESIERAQEFARDFRRAGIRAGCIEAATPGRLRSHALALLGDGTTRVITSVNTLTEGLDIPEVGVAILARRFEFVGTYLQAVGRISRMASGKEIATVIDLVGAVHRHGSPNMDRSWTLDGSWSAPDGGQEREPPERAALAIGNLPIDVIDPGSKPADWRPEPSRLTRYRDAEQDHDREQQVFKKHGSRAADFFSRYIARFHRKDASP